MTYSKQTAGVMMTLSAIAYAADIKDKTKKIEQAIDDQLTDNHTWKGKPYHYATGADWTRVWGPVQSDWDNLVFVAKNASTGALALVIRGTIGKAWSYIEDVPTGQTTPDYVPTTQNAMLSKEFSDGFNSILTLSFEGKVLEDFLKGMSSDPSINTLYVTGHSQGGGLTPMALAWITNNCESWGISSWAIEGYAFAPPTSGNPGFADWISNGAGVNAPTNLVMNPYDLVPMGYSEISNIIPNEIPTTVPLVYEVVIKAAEADSYLTGPWAQPAQNQVMLDGQRLPSDMSYLDQVEGQHNHNTYLFKLGVPQVLGIGTFSPFDPDPAAQ